MGDNRAERRRRERELRKNTKPSVSVDSDGISLNFAQYDQGSLGAMPPKQPGKHRWIVMAVYSVTEASVRGEAMGATAPATYLDQENRLSTMLGCWDCEKQYPAITADSTCAAPAAEAP